MKARKLILRTVFGAGVVLLAAIGYLQGIQLTGNFHPVEPGVAYRSAQPSAHDIATYAKDYGIRTIINLRGPSDGSKWYEAEIAQAKQNGIHHIDFAMSARKELTSDQAAQLIDLMKNAEKPLLIHCKVGADRSGLAAALYAAAILRRGKEEAASELSIRFGHISSPLKKTYAMDRSFEALSSQIYVTAN